MNKDFTMAPDITYSRRTLSAMMGLDDRAMRAQVRKQRREGVPIMAVRGGGYKIAETDQEKRELLHMYRKRALDELTTYYKLMKTLQVDGQITVDELMKKVEEAA